MTAAPPLDPAREFPVDGAAGEGFTNTGNALMVLVVLDLAEVVSITNCKAIMTVKL